MHIVTFNNHQVFSFIEEAGKDICVECADGTSFTLTLKRKKAGSIMSIYSGTIENGV